MGGAYSSVKPWVLQGLLSNQQVLSCRLDEALRASPASSTRHVHQHLIVPRQVVILLVGGEGELQVTAAQRVLALFQPLHDGFTVVDLSMEEGCGEVSECLGLPSCIHLCREADHNAHQSYSPTKAMHFTGLPKLHMDRKQGRHWRSPLVYLGPHPPQACRTRYARTI